MISPQYTLALAKLMFRLYTKSCYGMHYSNEQRRYKIAIDNMVMHLLADQDGRLRFDFRLIREAIRTVTFPTQVLAAYAEYDYASNYLVACKDLVKCLNQIVVEYHANGNALRKSEAVCALYIATANFFASYLVWKSKRKSDEIYVLCNMYSNLFVARRQAVLSVNVGMFKKVDDEMTRLEERIKHKYGDGVFSRLMYGLVAPPGVLVPA